MENLITEHGNYLGLVRNGVPHGKGLKKYKTGCSIEGGWIKGRPEGFATFSTSDFSVQVKFKSGKIIKILTENETLTIRFPYRFILTGENYQEIPEESSSGFYSILQGKEHLKMFQNAINRRLGPIKSFYLQQDFYIGEYNRYNKPHGYGILYKPISIYIGNFINGSREGTGYCLVNNLNLFKTEFRNDISDGYGKEKVISTNFKFIGFFFLFTRYGKFQVLFCDFKIECEYIDGILINPVRFYKNNKFLVQCSIHPLYFIPEHFYDHSELKEYILLACDTQKIPWKLGQVDKEREPSRADFQRLNQTETLKPKKRLRRVILPQDDCWITYEFRIATLYKVPQNPCLDLIQRKVTGKGNVFQGCIKQGQSHGCGKLVYPNKEFFVGMFEMGKRSGIGVYVKQGKIFFRGYWKNDQFDGRGEIFLPELKIVGIWAEGSLQHILKIIRF